MVKEKMEMKELYDLTQDTMFCVKFTIDGNKKRYVSRIWTNERGKVECSDSEDVNDAIFFHDKYSATSFVENQYIFRYNHFVSVEEVLCLLKVDNLKIMNSIDYAKIKQIGEVEIGEEHFVFDGVGRKLGGTIGFYVFLLTNPTSYMKKSFFTIKDSLNFCYDSYFFRTPPLYYPCDLFYEMNGKKNE